MYWWWLRSPGNNSDNAANVNNNGYVNDNGNNVDNDNNAVRPDSHPAAISDPCGSGQNGCKGIMFPFGDAYFRRKKCCQNIGRTDIILPVVYGT